MSEEKKEQVHTHVLPDGSLITHTHSHDHGHGHTHSHAHTKAVLNRLSGRSVIWNPLRDGRERKGLQRGADSALGCESSHYNTGKIILQDHIEHCIVDAVEHGDQEALKELEKAIDVSLNRRSRFLRKIKNRRRGIMAKECNSTTCTKEDCAGCSQAKKPQSFQVAVNELSEVKM